MATLLENANRIKTNKEDIRQAIISKGIDVPENESLDNYDEKIREINAITEKTLFKPHPNFIELKDYYVRKKVDGAYQTEKIVIPDKFRFRCFYNSMSSNYNTTSSNAITIQTQDENYIYDFCFSKQYIDNFFPKFFDYYVYVHRSSTNGEKTIDIVEFSYVKSYDDGLSDTGKDSSGIQFFNKINIISSSANYQTGKTTNGYDFHSLVKLSNDTGMILYYTVNQSNDLAGNQSARIFKISKNKIITIYSATSITVADTSALTRTFYLASSLNAPNQIFLLCDTYTDSTGVSTNTFFQLSCNTQNISSGTSGVTVVRSAANSDANTQLGDSNTYIFSKGHFANDLAVYTRQKISNNVVNLYTYLGDNRTNAIDSGDLTFTNNMEPISLPVKGLKITLYKDGIYNTELCGTSDSKIGTLNAYIKGRNIDGNYIITYTITTDIGTSAPKDYVANFDTTNKIFYIIKEL